MNKMVMCKLQREYYSSAMYIERTYKIDGNVRKIFMPEQKAVPGLVQKGAAGNVSFSRR